MINKELLCANNYNTPDPCITNHNKGIIFLSFFREQWLGEMSHRQLLNTEALSCERKRDEFTRILIDLTSLYDVNTNLCLFYITTLSH